jgi:hypothetical protein
MTSRKVEQMTTQDIVRNSDEMKNNAHLDWKETYAALYESLKSDKYRIMRENNTLFWYRIDEPSVAQLFIFNADKPVMFLHNLRGFFQAIQSAGFHTVYGITENPKVLEFLKRTGFPTDVERLPALPDGTPQYKGVVHV